MNAKSVLRENATPLVALVFAVVGTTGVLMYFHLLDSYTKELHETLGLAFVAAVAGHLYVNWRGMKSHLAKPVFFVWLGVVGIVSAGYIATAKPGPDPKKTMITATLNAPMELSSRLLGQDFETTRQTLKTHGIDVTADSTLAAVAKEHGRSPFELVGWITETQR